MLPITSSLYNNAVPWQYGCTQPKKRRRITEKKARYSDKFLVASTLTPPRQHQKSNISKNNASKKGTVH
jgi:hypothetical protein